jgi:5-methylthioribose kinase
VIEVDQQNVLDYLQRRQSELSGWPAFADGELATATATELAWGVSNIVLRVDTLHRSFVVKQSRKQLRTAIDWFSQLERVWREVAAMRALEKFLPPAAVPRVLFEDRENYLFAMEAVEADHRVWKSELLNGQLDVEVAARLGRLLAIVHRDSRDSTELSESLGDRTIFDELRLDPFYRYVADTTSDEQLAASLTSLIDDTLARQDCLVLADFSPKNILLTSNGPVVVDFETAHIGDPGFDIGFFLSHLLLKAVFHHERFEDSLGLACAFWQEYCGELASGLRESDDLDFERQCVRHLAACMLARVDGKSRVDYLKSDWQVSLVRSLCRDVLVSDGAGDRREVGWCFGELARRLTAR